MLTLGHVIVIRKTSIKAPDTFLNLNLRRLIHVSFDTDC